MSKSAPAVAAPYLFAFLRAVNLGQKNKVPMKSLLDSMSRRGLPPASYLLASGNLVFGANDVQAVELGSTLARVINDEFGVDTHVVLRTDAELRRLLDNDPFSQPEGGNVHVALWNSDETVPSQALSDLTSADFAPDQIAPAEHGVYLRYDTTSHTSKLSNQLLERRLGVRSTARNMNTIRRLLTRWPPSV